MSNDQRTLRNRIIVSALQGGINPKEVARHVGLRPSSVRTAFYKETGNRYKRPVVWKHNLKLRSQLKRVRELLTLFPTMTLEPFDEPGWERFCMLVIE